jgi:hypothetical protein
VQGVAKRLLDVAQQPDGPREVQILVTGNLPRTTSPLILARLARGAHRADHQYLNREHRVRRRRLNGAPSALSNRRPKPPRVNPIRFRIHFGFVLHDAGLQQIGIDTARATRAGTRAVAVDPIVCKSRRRDTGVNDEHGPRAMPRQPRRMGRSRLPLPPARARISSTVGALASSMSLPRRYSCSDWPADTARRRSTAWVSSGTSLI